MSFVDPGTRAGGFIRLFRILWEFTELRAFVSGNQGSSDFTRDWTRAGVFATGVAWNVVFPARAINLGQMHAYVERIEGNYTLPTLQRFPILRFILTVHSLPDTDLDQEQVMGGPGSTERGNMEIDVDRFASRSYWRDVWVSTGPNGVIDIDTEGGGLPEISVEKSGNVTTHTISLGLIMVPQ